MGISKRVMDGVCSNGCGPTERQPGWWSLTGWSDAPAPADRLPDGTAYLLRLYKCPACGLVQLYDEDPRAAS